MDKQIQIICKWNIYAKQIVHKYKPMQFFIRNILCPVSHIHYDSSSETKDSINRITKSVSHKIKLV